MTRTELNRDWLNWFKLAVAQARDARLKGDIDVACSLDRIVERYYPEAVDHGFDEDALFTIESDTRNQTAGDAQ